MIDRKKPGVAFWATVMVVLVPALYVASLFPIAWLIKRGMLGEGDGFPARILIIYLTPVKWLGINGPVWVSRFLDWIGSVTA